MILLIRRRTVLPMWVALCLTVMAAVFWSGSRGTVTTAMAAQRGTSATVVIDPGHGGEDGGAVSPDGVEESTVNLAVSLRLEGVLRFMGVPTEMTRREDVMVCDPGLDTIRARKASDIRNRVAQVNAVPDAVLLSIHQNSLPSSVETHGAQVFWNSAEGAETLADMLQTELNTAVNTHRSKEAKPISNSIYLMKHVTAPAVLVECGFLSNVEETVLLQTAEHQTKLAAVIAAGYLRWATENG